MVHYNYEEKLLCIIHHLPLGKKTIAIQNLFSGDFGICKEKKIDFVTTVFGNLTPSYLQKEF